MKLWIWIATAVGLVPAGFVFGLAWALLRAHRRMDPLMESAGRTGRLHDEYFVAGPWHVTTDARGWVVAVGALGIALVLFALFMTLHGPSTRDF